MSDPLTPDFLAQELSRLHAHAGALLELLEREREALINRDIEALEKITDKKEVVCSTLASIQSQFAARTIKDHLSDIPIQQRSSLVTQYEQLIELIESCKHLNQVNGKITHRSQQSNLAMLKMLTGEVNSLYEQHGRSQTDRPRMNTPIVKA
ncbi:MAG: flagellar export chaperone FlgN [Gammaproteobacteria bacterium]|nr:flagellar export chaperone FlgN [Gammaproteobacteria bacterium]